MRNLFSLRQVCPQWAWRRHGVGHYMFRRHHFDNRRSLGYSPISPSQQLVQYLFPFLIYQIIQIINKSLIKDLIKINEKVIE